MDIPQRVIVAKKKVKKKVKKTQRVGRPKKTYTKEQVKKIEECAFHGCQTETIATLTGIPASTLRDNFRGFLAKKRAERKLELRKAQDRQAQVGNSAILIFLGKNELEQSDTKDQNINAQIEIKPVLTIEEIKKRIKAYEEAGLGLDYRSIEGHGSLQNEVISQDEIVA